MADKRISPFGITDQSELAAAYRKIGSIKPYTKADIAKALKPYNLGPSTRRKGKNDVQLEQIAAKAVVAKYRAGLIKPKVSAKAAPAAKPPAKRAAAPKAAPAPKPKVLTPAQVSARLKAFGAPTTWKPPSYALTSPAQLDAWIKRAMSYAKAAATRVRTAPPASKTSRATANITKPVIPGSRLPIAK